MEVKPESELSIQNKLVLGFIFLWMLLVAPLLFAMVAISRWSDRHHCKTIH
jgi:hypothetical protein